MGKYVKLILLVFLISLSLSSISSPAFGTDLVFNSIVYITTGTYTVPSGYALKITSACIPAHSGMMGGSWQSLSGWLKVGGVVVYCGHTYSATGDLSEAYDIGRFPVWVEAGTSVTSSNVYFTGVLYQVI